MNHDLLENGLTDFSLISHTSCVGCVVQVLQISPLSVWLDFEIVDIIQNEGLPITVAMVTGVARKPMKTKL